MFYCHLSILPNLRPIIISSVVDSNSSLYTQVCKNYTKKKKLYLSWFFSYPNLISFSRSHTSPVAIQSFPFSFPRQPLHSNRIKCGAKSYVGGRSVASIEITSWYYLDPRSGPAGCHGNHILIWWGCTFPKFTVFVSTTLAIGLIVWLSLANGLDGHNASRSLKNSLIIVTFSWNPSTAMRTYMG